MGLIVGAGIGDGAGSAVGEAVGVGGGLVGVSGDRLESGPALSEAGLGLPVERLQVL